MGSIEENINVFDFIVGNVLSLPLKVQNGSLKCLVDAAYLPVPALWKEISTIPMDRKLSQRK